MPGRRILALVALLGCAATACSDADSDPPPDKPATHSSIDSPTTRSAPSDPVVNAPALPRGARKHSLAGAEAFVRHYIDLLNYAANTGIVTELRRAARHCDGCRIYENLYRRTYARGGYIRTPGWKPLEVQAFDQQNEIAVLVKIDAPRTRFKKTRDGETYIGRGGKHKLKFEVAPRQGSGWVVRYFGVQGDLPGDR